MAKQAFQIGDEVKVEFRGKIFRVEQDTSGKVVYDIRGNNLIPVALNVSESYLVEEEGGKDERITGE